MTETTDTLIATARNAYEAAVAARESWADEVDQALEAAGYRTLDAVAYGAELDTCMVAVVDLDGAATGIWRYDDGTWTTGEAERSTSDITTLDELYSAMRGGQITQGWDDLPTFGGADIEDTHGVWSWDARRMIFGTCADDIEIVPRED